MKTSRGTSSGLREIGSEWRPKGEPEKVNVHDFIDKELGKLTPYGVYDVAAECQGG